MFYTNTFCCLFPLKTQKACMLLCQHLLRFTNFEKLFLKINFSLICYDLISALKKSCTKIQLKEQHLGNTKKSILKFWPNGPSILMCWVTYMDYVCDNLGRTTLYFKSFSHSFYYIGLIRFLLLQLFNELTITSSSWQHLPPLLPWQQPPCDKKW